MRIYHYSVLMGVCMLLFSAQVVEAGLLLGREDRERATTRARVERTVAGPWLMSYYVGYQNGYLKPKDVDYSLMTHIVVGGVGVEDDGTLNEHWHMENGDGRDMAREVGSRADREGVQKLIWLGGPNEEEKFFNASASEHRAAFVNNIIKLVRELDYDGVDLDWEPIRQKDEPRILRLVRDLRKADPDLIITIPVNWVPSTTLTRDRDVYEEIAQYADKLFIMSYSMAGPWPGWQSWHGGALRGDTLTTPGSIRTSVYAYERAGVPMEKLGIGIGTYATCWEYPVNEPQEVLPATFYPRDVHVMSMRTLYDDYHVARYEKWDPRAQVPYLSFPTGIGDFSCGFISYEDERSIEAKAAYVREEGLGGAIVWNIGTGYFTDAPYDERHRLLRAASNGLE